MNSLANFKSIERKIYLIRGQRVMLDSDLAAMYGVKTGDLNRAVKRNAERFPDDFMFPLTANEAEALRCQIGILELRVHLGSQRRDTTTRGNQRKYLPYVFTGQGVAMLSSVLRSRQAAQANIAIMRAFVDFRETIVSHKDLVVKREELEKKYDSPFAVVFEAIRELMTPPAEEMRKIGFPAKEDCATYAASSVN